jgi:uncharacterized protein YodC (DUF2158 family)
MTITVLVIFGSFGPAHGSNALPIKNNDRQRRGIKQHVCKCGNIDEAIPPSPIHSRRRERGAEMGRETSEVLIMLNLRKPAVIAMQAAMGLVLGVPCAVTALAEDAPANTATQTQATPALRGGDLVRLRSGGPVLTVKSVHGNWIICTWWHEGFGQFRTAGFPSTMIEGPITLPPPAAAPQTDASLQTTGQASPAAQSGPPPGNLSNAGQANQNPTALAATQTTGVAPTRPANARTSTNAPTTPAPGSPSQQGTGQTNQGTGQTNQSTGQANQSTGQTNQSPISQGANQPPTVGRVIPGVVFPQGTVQLVVPLQQGSIDGGRARPSLILPQGTVQSAIPLQQSAAGNQAVATGQTQTVGAAQAASARASMSPQAAAGRR